MRRGAARRRAPRARAARALCMKEEEEGPGEMQRASTRRSPPHTHQSSARISGFISTHFIRPITLTTSTFTLELCEVVKESNCPQFGNGSPQSKRNQKTMKQGTKLAFFYIMAITLPYARAWTDLTGSQGLVFTSTSDPPCPAPLTKQQSFCVHSCASYPCCTSVFFSPDDPVYYSRVRGVVVGRQFRDVKAFANGQGKTIDDPYVDGVSITVRNMDSNDRAHVWTSAVAATTLQSQPSQHLCPCHGGPTPPAFVGNNYYCDSSYGGEISQIDSTEWRTAKLWDDEEQGSCMQTAFPAMFDVELEEVTDSAVELRLCTTEVRNLQTTLNATSVVIFLSVQGSMEMNIGIQQIYLQVQETTAPTPKADPTSSPSSDPTPSPSSDPTPSPSSDPTPSPSSDPTPSPTSDPTPSPSSDPTPSPSSSPSSDPSVSPSSSPQPADPSPSVSVSATSSAQPADPSPTPTSSAQPVDSSPSSTPETVVESPTPTPTPDPSSEPESPAPSPTSQATPTLSPTSDVLAGDKSKNNVDAPEDDDETSNILLAVIFPIIVIAIIVILIIMWRRRKLAKKEEQEAEKSQSLNV